MDELRNSVVNFGTIDFEGQKKASQVSFAVLVGGAVLSFVAGLATQHIEYTVYGLAATFVAAELVVIAPLPAYNKNALEYRNPWRD